MYIGEEWCKMKIGKVPNDILEELVFKHIKHKRNEVLTRPGIGEDCGVIDFGQLACVVSTDPITGASENIGSLAVHISCNDVASNGADPVGILMTILAPEGTTEEDLDRIMKDAGEIAATLNVEIIGGHTEITNAVNKIVISTTVIGMQPKNKVPNSKSVKIGDKVIITKSAGIEGTSIIASELEENLKDKMSEKELDEAKAFINSVSVVKEGKICGEIGVPYMHDITEGGLLGAIWEASKSIDKGIYIEKGAIPIENVTKKICDIFNIDPLKLISSGSMLIISPIEKVQEILEKLNGNNIQASVIGEVTETGVKMLDDEQIRDINPPESDELYKVV